MNKYKIMRNRVITEYITVQAETAQKAIEEAKTYVDRMWSAWPDVEDTKGNTFVEKYIAIPKQ